MSTNKEIILTGDRPTGPLHLGHFVDHLITESSFRTQENTINLL